MPFPIKLRSVAARRPALALASSLAFAAPAFATTPYAAADSNYAVLASKLSFAPLVGVERFYSLHSTGTAAVNVAALAAHLSPQSTQTKGEKQEHRFEVSARLGLRVLAQRGDGFVVAMRLADPEYRVDGVADTRVQVLTTPFVVHMSKRGELQRFDFPVRFPEEAKLAIRALVEPLQVVVLPSDNGSWSVGESSINGKSTVQYRVGSVDQAAKVARLERKVLASRRALPGTVDSSERGQFHSRVNLSDGSIDWALDGTGVKKMSLRESTSSFMGRQEIATNDTTFEASLVTTPVTGLPTSVEAAKAALKDQSAARASFYHVPAYMEEKIRGVDWDSALAFYQQHVHVQPAEANVLMQYYLRKHPENALAFATALNEASKGERTEELENLVGYGFATLAAAGHTHAQRVIVDAFSQPQWTELSQEKALDAVLSLEMPETFVPAAIWTLRSKLPTNGPVANERLSITTNLYGYAGQAELGVESNTDEVVKNLEQLLKKGEIIEQERGLVALGNIRDTARTLPMVEPFFRSRHEALRSVAFDCFRTAQDPAHMARFVELYNAETSPFVRREASAVALTMADSPARSAWAVDQAKNASDPIIRTRAVEALGRTVKENPANEAALRDLLATVKDREVRRAIYRFISPKARGNQ